MSDLDSFVLGLWNQPEDITSRLVFADWLQDRDDPLSGWVRDAHDTWTALLPFGLVGSQRAAPDSRVPVYAHRADPLRWAAMSIRAPISISGASHSIHIHSVVGIDRLGLSQDGGTSPARLMVLMMSGERAFLETQIGPLSGFEWEPTIEGFHCPPQMFTFLLSGPLGATMTLCVDARFPAPAQPDPPNRKRRRKSPA